MTSFLDSSLVNVLPQYNLYFSSLAVNDKLITCETPNPILKTALPFSHEIKLKYNENNISIAIALYRQCKQKNLRISFSRSQQRMEYYL